MGDEDRFVSEDGCDTERVGLAATLDLEDELGLFGLIDVGAEEEEVAEDAGILILL